MNSLLINLDARLAAPLAGPWRGMLLPSCWEGEDVRFLALTLPAFSDQSPHFGSVRDIHNFIHQSKDGIVAFFIADIIDSVIGPPQGMELAHMTCGILSDLCRQLSSPQDVLSQANITLRDEVRGLFISSRPLLTHPPSTGVNKRSKTKSDPYGYFATAFCAFWDSKTKTLRFGNAGHEKALIYRSALQHHDLLDAEGFPLGMFDDGCFEERKVELTAGDIVLLYTNGIVNARNGGGQTFGRGRLQQLLHEKAPSGLHSLLVAICRDILTFTDEQELRDDIAVVAMQVVDRNVVSREIPGIVPHIPVTVESVLDTAQNKGFTGDMFHLRLALEEALLNAVKHGCQGNADKRIWVWASVERHRVEVHVRDEGNGFEYRTLPPLSPGSLFEGADKTGDGPLRASGRGLQLIHSCVDALEFRGRGNHVRMVLYGT